jgi:hypothetical protein
MRAHQLSTTCRPPSLLVASDVPTDDSNARRAATAYFDNDIAVLKDALRRLLQRRNVFVPAHRLPPELLSKVFRHVSEEEPVYSSLKAAVCLSHVCQWWRSTAFSEPYLWTRINVVCVSLMEHALSLSAEAPIHIYIQENETNKMDDQKISLKTLTSCIRAQHRIQSVVISLRASLMEQLGMWFLKELTLAPLLSHLTMHVKLREEVLLQPLDLPPLSRDKLPSLRYIELRGCRPNYERTTKTSFECLTSLSYTQISVQLSIELDHLLRAMDQTRQLRHLVLTNLNEVMHDVHGPQVHLATLQTLSLSGSAGGCYYILRRIKQSTMTTLTMDIDHNSWPKSEPHQSMMAATLLGNDTGSHNTFPATRVSLSLTAPFHLLLWHAKDNTVGHPTCRLTISRVNPGLLRPLLEALWDAVDWTFMLQLTIQYGGNTETALEMFRMNAVDMVDITRLTVSCCFVPLQRLALGRHTSLPQEIEPILRPELDSVINELRDRGKTMERIHLVGWT